jgi:hypothetical protein
MDERTLACGCGGNAFILGEWCGFVNAGLGQPSGASIRVWMTQNPAQGSTSFTFHHGGITDMSSITGSVNKSGSAWCITLAGIMGVIIVVSGVTNLRRSSTATNNITMNQGRDVSRPRAVAEQYQAVAYQDKVAGAGPALVTTALREPGTAKTAVDSAMDRKMVRNSSVDLVVRKPAEAAEKIRALAEGMGGFLMSSEVSGGQDAAGASLTVRVPAARFEEARTEIRKLGLRVESEKVQAQDVTRQYVDEDANLRNLRAEEAQYLAIMKQAHTVKDTLEVSDKLSGVRGQIEQQQAEFDALSKQIETVAINVLLRAEAEAQVFGLHWRPLYQLKLGLSDGLGAVAGYAAAMTSILFYLPAVLLWIFTIGFGAAVGWRVLRWAARVFFAWPKQSAVQQV